ncbi:protocadherin beta-4-like [Octodon degus]|uniref:Protocadherin beta-4-like n=1 Tax=Octodon degus TaxID=10160 RepID=A0A6P3VEC8_OCTDE|nr:protocadherin beta-4-like [Octodon degus]
MEKLYGIHPKRQVMSFIFVVFLSRVWLEPIHYSVWEETTGGAFLAHLTKELGLGTEELAARSAQVVFDDDKQHLLLDPQTGDLLLRETLDREELCGPAEPCVLYFQVFLEMPVQFFQGELWIQDINDHSPTFPDGKVLLKIPESSQPGTVFPLKSAQDLDVGSNGIQTYTISPNDHFHVLTRNNSEGMKFPDLVQDKPLDREEQAEYSLILMALDGGSPPRSGTVMVQILILDVNDNAPEFVDTPYEVQVQENSPLNSLILTVSARDKDAGHFGSVSYGLFQPSDEIKRTFSIHEVTGEIRLQKKLDYEKIKSYRVEIEATDGGGLSGKGTVVIEVVDVNDNAPELTITSLTTSIPENASVTVVSIFKIRDKDSGDNGKMICSIPDNLPFILKQTFKNFYTLKTENPLDRETTAEYNITITVTDLGTPRLKTQHTITLQLIDINDHSPEFSEREILLTIQENAHPGTVFPLKIAQDLDIGSNTVQNYTINPNAHFHVVTHSRGDGRKYPELVLDKALDREDQADLSLILTAVDGGDPPRSGTTTVRIEVVDINDNAPEFLQSLYEAQIPENTALNSIIVIVSAQDLDAGTHGSVVYTFHGGEVIQPFAIDKMTGEIRLKRTLDFEENRYYSLEIVATDTGGLSGKCTVAIEVLDVNDNAPELTMSTLSRSIPENSPETVVAIFSISDPDSGDNGRMVCSIQNDVPFLLKPSFKNFYTLVTEGPLDRESRAEYNITITVTDLGTPRLKTQHTITVQVSDVNDNAPTFTQSSYTLFVPENNSPALLIGTISATDRDSGSNAQSASVTLHVLLVDGFSQPYLPAAEAAPERAQPASLTAHLVVALAAVSSLFLLSLLLFVALRLCRRSGPAALGVCSAAPEGPFPAHLVDVSGTGTLSHSYQYEVCLSGGTGTNDFKFLKPIAPNILLQDT